MSENTVLILIVFLSVDAVALFSLLFFHLYKEHKRNKIRRYGEKAEAEVTAYLKREFPGSVLMNNVFLQFKNRCTQIDHILICKWGLYLLETKSHNGKINTEKNEWIQFYGDKIVRFHSPLLQNESHKKAMEHILNHNKMRHIPVHAVVVFTSKKVYFTKRQKDVLRLEELGPYIKNGGTKSRRKAVTAEKGRFYLTRQKILAIESVIRKNQVKSRKLKTNHERTVRFLDRRSRIL